MSVAYDVSTQVGRPDRLGSRRSATVLPFPRQRAESGAAVAQEPAALERYAPPAVEQEPHDDPALMPAADRAAAVLAGPAVDMLPDAVPSWGSTDARPGCVPSPWAVSRPRQPDVRAIGAIPAPGLRLTIRGRRIVAALCAIGVAAGLWITIASIHSSFAGPLVPSSAPAVVTVHTGDTLWSIAGRIAPDRDPRAVVDALRKSNHLASSTVRLGQRLVVPR